MSEFDGFKLLIGKNGKPTSNNIPLRKMTNDPQPDYGDSYRPPALHKEVFGRSVIPDYDQSIKPSKFPGAVNNTPLELSTPPDYDDSDEEEPSIYSAKKHKISVFDNHPPAVAKKPTGGVKMFTPAASSHRTKMEPMEPSMKLGSRVLEVRTVLKDDSSVNFKDDISQVKNLALLPVLSLDTISDCIERRYKQDLIYVSTNKSCLMKIRCSV